MTEPTNKLLLRGLFFSCGLDVKSATSILKHPIYQHLICVILNTTFDIFKYLFLDVRLFGKYVQYIHFNIHMKMESIINAKN